MIILIIIVIILVILLAILNKVPPINNEEVVETKYDLSKYQTKHYIMTSTELTFYRILKEITDELDLTIFPQVRLEQIIQVSDKNSKDRNRIKSRSIDYTIVNNNNCKIVLCVELDDYSHNRESVKKTDEFRNNLFSKVGIPLYRIQVKDMYNKEEVRKILQERLHK